jgi:hypothetical protein
MFVEIYFAVTLKVGFGLSGQFGAVSHDSHSVMYLPNILDKFLVAEEIDCQLIVQQEHILELDILGNVLIDVAEADIVAAFSLGLIHLCHFLHESFGFLVFMPFSFPPLAFLASRYPCGLRHHFRSCLPYFS